MPLISRRRVQTGRLPSASSGAASNYRYPPEFVVAQKGEKFLFQTGESMAYREVPEGTRVIYPGVRANGVKDREEMRRMIRNAFDNPVNAQPLREKLRALKAVKASPTVVMAFDDVSVPLPPMATPDLRTLIMEEAEALCVAEGITDIKFICSIALHRCVGCC